MSMLIFNDEMYSFLQFAQRESIIAALFLQGDSSHINDEGNYVKRVEDEIDVVSFLPKILPLLGSCLNCSPKFSKM